MSVAEPEIFIWRGTYSPGFLGDIRAPGRGLSGEAPLGGCSSLQTLLTDFVILSAETIKICKFRTIHFLILDQYRPMFHSGGGG